MHNRLLLAIAVAAAILTPTHPALCAEDPPKDLAFEKLYFVHFSHTDLGFTDQPSLCRELHRRYLDAALDTVLDSMRGPDDARFFWTAESQIVVRDWWESASAGRRREFLRAVKSGQLDIAALPFNQTPFQNAAQWREMHRWLPADLARQIVPKVAMQCDVNGLPRAGALGLLDRGIHRVFMCINPDSGGPPQATPSAFWWKMPDNRRLFVWLNGSYPWGYFFFEPQEWRRGPVPAASDTCFRPPRSGDLLRTDETSLRNAHKNCAARLTEIRRQGYPHKILVTSMTSQWRMDNDPPFAPLADFAAAWNRAGLKPELVFTTASKAMEILERELGPTAPEYTGEFTDWWANGDMSAPREVAASRRAKRLLAAAESPVWGKADSRVTSSLSRIYQELCLFNEHTWGHNLSVASPDSLETKAQFTEKALLAYRPMAQAEWLLSQRVRTRLINSGEGLFVINPAQAPFSGWIRITASCLREDFRAVEDPLTGERIKLLFEPGIQPWGRPSKPEDLTSEDLSATFPDNAPAKTVKFWVENMPGQSIRRLRFSHSDVPTPEISSPLEIKTDTNGWPLEVRWPGMNQPLFNEGLGDFLAVKVHGFAPRWILRDIRDQQAQARDRLRAEKLEEMPATPQPEVQRIETAHSVTYVQSIAHPRLQWAKRVLELWKHEPRGRLTMRLNRLTSAAPEIFYLEFPLPTGEILPTISNGGVKYTPFSDQIPGTCRDYFAFDGWANYTTRDGHWIWASRDAPLITFGRNPTLSLRKTVPKDVHRVRAILLDNFWYTNFLADEPGIMEFQFDLFWKSPSEDSQVVERAAEAAFAEPVTLLNPASPEDPRIVRRLYAP